MKRKLIVLLLLLLLFGGCSTSEKNSFTEVPNVVGMKLGKAQDMLNKIGLVMQVSDTQQSETIPIDYIISQDPQPQTSIKSGSIVKVVVSAGSKDVTVPDITKKDFYDALTILKNSGLNIGEISEVESDENIGQVLFQEPEPGTIVSPGTRCNLTVSIGRFIVVPNVIGMEVKKAKDLMTSLGLDVYKIDEIDKGVGIPSGIVLYQYPFPNAKVASGALVLLKVSK